MHRRSRCFQLRTVNCPKMKWNVIILEKYKPANYCSFTVTSFPGWNVPPGFEPVTNSLSVQNTVASHVDAGVAPRTKTCVTEESRAWHVTKMEAGLKGWAISVIGEPRGRTDGLFTDICELHWKLCLCCVCRLCCCGFQWATQGHQQLQGPDLVTCPSSSSRSTWGSVFCMCASVDLRGYACCIWRSKREFVSFFVFSFFIFLLVFGFCD